MKKIFAILICGSLFFGIGYSEVEAENFSVTELAAPTPKKYVPPPARYSPPQAPTYGREPAYTPPPPPESKK